MIEFELADPPESPPDPGCPHGCHDLKPTEADCNWWSLTVEEGEATVVCSTCRCVYDPILWDGGELLFSSEDIPVRVQFEMDCGGGSWHGMNACDHGWSINITPRKN